MNKFLLVLFLSLNFNAFSSDSIFSEDTSFQYWKGFSNAHPTRAKAYKEAYNDAVNEAIKYNFGFAQDFTENFEATLKKNSYFKESSQKFSQVQLKKIKPESVDCSENKNLYTCNVKISYPKSEIKKEELRLRKNLKVTHTSTSKNDYQLHNLKITTFPSKATVTLIPLSFKDEKLVSSSNAIFNLALGKYLMIIEKNGFEKLKQEIIVSPNNLNLSYKLTELGHFLFVKTFPKDAKVYLNNKLINSDKPIRVSRGISSLSVKHDKFYQKNIDIDINSKNTYKKIILEPKTSFLSIDTKPSGAKIYIDGEYKGNSPLYNIPSNNLVNEINIIKKGYKLLYKKYQIKPDSSNDLFLKLEEKKVY